MVFVNRLMTVLLLIGLGWSASAQQYDVKSGSRCIVNDGDTLMLMFSAVPTPASGGTVTFTFSGDLDGTGTNLEAFDFYSENGGLLTSSFSISQCSGVDSITYNIPLDSLIDWGSDGTIFFIADATSAVGATVCNPGTCAEARLAYQFVTVPNDIRVSSLVSPRNFCAGNEDIIVEISNSGTNQVSSAQVNWTFDGVLQTAVPFNGLLDTIGGTGANAAQITLGNRNFATGVQHDIVAWTSLPNGVADANPVNDTIEVNRLQPALAGTFSIGPSGDYQAISTAVADLAQFGVCGPVTFNIAKDTFTEQILVPLINGVSPTNTITFQSASGNASDVVITSPAATSTNNYIVQFDGAKHVAFKNVSVINPGITYGTAFRMVGNCSNLTIEGCTIEGPYRNSTSSNLSLIFANGDKIDSVTIQDNYLGGGSYGTYFRSNTSLNGVANKMLNNVVETYYRGLSVYYQDALILDGNTITSNTFGSYNFFYAIEAGSCENGSFITNNVINTETGSYGIYMPSSDNLPTNPTLIANNMIHVGGTGTAYGIYLSSIHNNTNVYHNSVNITSSSTSGRALFISASGSNVNAVNNILNNESNGYAIYLSSSAALNTVDYNLLFTQGSNLAYYVLGPYTTLADYQNVSGLDANSLSFPAPFVSSTDLHVTPVVNETGTALSSVPFDIDGDPRDPTRPDVGADEIVPGPIDMATLALLDPVSGCGLSSAETIRALFVSYGNDPVAVGTTVPVSYAVDGGLPVTENMTIQKVLNFRDTVIYTFTTPADLGLGGDYDLDISVSIPGDGDASNDEISEVVTNNSAPTLPQIIDFESWGPVGTDPSCQSAGAIPQDGWTQDEEDDGNWNVNSGPTPTSGTGPVFDFLPGTTNGKYLYVESAFPCYGSEVSLLSPCIDLASMTRPGLNFAYHMFGSFTGSLHVDIVRGSLVIPNAWVAIGDQGNQWRQAVVDLTRFANFGEVRVRIRATIGTSTTSDIAIDDLRLGELPNIDLGNGPIADCGFVDLDSKVSNADSYQWNTGDTTKSIRITNTGNQTSTASYAVTVTKNGLFNVDTIEVTLEPGPIVDLGPDELTVCEVDTVTLDAGNPGLKHQWENGFFAQRRLIQQPGTYWVSVDDLKGCVKSDTITVTFNEAPTATSFTYGNVAGLSRLIFYPTGTADDDYLWDFGDGSGSTVQNPTHLFAGPGTYTVTLIVSNDCGADTTTQQVEVWPTGLDEPASLTALSLSPNPTEGLVVLNMTVDQPGDWTATILDVSGRMVEAVNLGMVQQQAVHEFDLQQYAKGLYFLRLQSEHDQVIRKLIVQ